MQMIFKMNFIYDKMVMKKTLKNILQNQGFWLMLLP